MQIIDISKKHIILFGVDIVKRIIILFCLILIPQKIDIVYHRW